MKSSSQLVYERIKKEIMFMELLPGDSINEAKTAARFNVSRTPVRDAFRRLELEGLILVQRGLGTSVCLIDIDEIDEIIYMRWILETNIVKEIGKLAKSQEVGLNLLLRKQKALLGSDLGPEALAKRFLELDNELHAAIFRLANKTNVWRRISYDVPHYSRLRVLTNLYQKGELENLYQEHKRIVEAIVAQNYADIEDCYRKHLYRGMTNLSNIVSEYPDFFEVGSARN